MQTSPISFASLKAEAKEISHHITLSQHSIGNISFGSYTQLWSHSLGRHRESRQSEHMQALRVVTARAGYVLSDSFTSQIGDVTAISMWSLSDVKV